MNKSLRVLVIEDNSTDAELLIRELLRAGYSPEWRRVYTESDFLNELQKAPELILSDYSMPSFDGLQALDLLRARNLDIPFILVSGTVGEETAVQAMRRGANDYLLKDRIARLGTAVQRVLEEKRLRDEHARTRQNLRQTEAEMASRQQQLNSFFKGATAGLALLDTELRFVQINDTLADMNGATAKEHLGRTLREMLSELSPVVEPIVQKVLATKQPALNVEFSGATARDPGVQREWLASYFPICNTQEQATGIGAIVIEITQRKQAEAERVRTLEQLRSSEERFRQLAETIEEVFWITDPAKNQMLYVSPGYEKIWGRTCESLYSAPRTWMDSIHPADRTRVLQAALSRQMAGTYDEEYRIVRPDGKIRWIRDQAFPVRDSSGQVGRVVGVARDITESKKLEEQFRQSQKMEAIGQLAGGVAHDFNNILAAIMMQSELAKMIANTPSAVVESIEQIRSYAERAANLSRQLLLFSSRQVMQPRNVDLNEVVNSLAKMLQRIIGEDVRLQLHLKPTPLIVHADAGMLDQVLMNLAVNARDAMPRGGRLLIETSDKEIDNTAPGSNRTLRQGRYVCLKVSDTGIGIPDGILPRIFEPFFTTKEPGKGTGLGLATVFGIVKQHQGRIDVTSKLDEGASFEILLPAAQSNEPLSSAKPTAIAPAMGTETVLLVEDEPEVRRLTKLTLEHHGYRVIVCANGIEAMEQWRQHSASVALLLTDLVMPGGMTGQELAKRLCADNPRLKVLFTSGYSAELAERGLVLQDRQNFLPKPCRPGELLATVRRCLDT